MPVLRDISDSGMRPVSLLLFIQIFNILTANSSLTGLFEGEPGHLVPSASHFLVESDMFMVAGRMIGHSFLHGGPCLQGLSPAVIHVLLGGSPDTATVTLEDCPDLDIRETIRLVCLIRFFFPSVICYVQWAALLLCIHCPL